MPLFNDTPEKWKELFDYITEKEASNQIPVFLQPTYQNPLFWNYAIEQWKVLFSNYSKEEKFLIWGRLVQGVKALSEQNAKQIKLENKKWMQDQFQELEKIYSSHQRKCIKATHIMMSVGKISTISLLIVAPLVYLFKIMLPPFLDFYKATVERWEFYKNLSHHTWESDEELWKEGFDNATIAMIREIEQGAMPSSPSMVAVMELIIFTGIILFVLSALVYGAQVFNQKVDAFTAHLPPLLPSPEPLPSSLCEKSNQEEAENEIEMPHRREYELD